MDLMPKKTVDVKPGEYAAFVYEYDEKQYHQKIGGFWVVPTRVYRGGPGRQEIQFERNGETEHRNSHPGAASFELYKRVP